MSILQNETELLQCFRELERSQVEILPDFRFPLEVKLAHTWLESSGARAYLLFQDEGARLPKGIVFQRNSAFSPDVPAMCEWCHSIKGQGRVRLLSAQSSPKRRVGLYLCHDLSCVMEAGGLPSAEDYPQDRSTEERAIDLRRRMSQFAARSIF